MAHAKSKPTILDLRNTVKYAADYPTIDTKRAPPGGGGKTSTFFGFKKNPSPPAIKPRPKSFFKKKKYPTIEAVNQMPLSMKLCVKSKWQA